MDADTMDTTDADAVDAAGGVLLRELWWVGGIPTGSFAGGEYRRDHARSSTGLRLVIAGSSAGGGSVRGAITSVLLSFLIDFLTPFLSSFRLALSKPYPRRAGLLPFWCLTGQGPTSTGAPHIYLRISFVFSYLSFH